MKPKTRYNIRLAKREAYGYSLRRLRCCPHFTTCTGRQRHEMVSTCASMNISLPFSLPSVVIQIHQRFICCSPPRRKIFLRVQSSPLAAGRQLTSSVLHRVKKETSWAPTLFIGVVCAWRVPGDAAPMTWELFHQRKIRLTHFLDFIDLKQVSAGRLFTDRIMGLPIDHDTYNTFRNSEVLNRDGAI